MDPNSLEIFNNKTADDIQMKYLHCLLESKFEKFLNDKTYRYIPINNTQSLAKIYNLYINNIFFEPETSEEIHYVAFYYQNIKPDYDKMEMYYLKNIDAGNSYSMSNFGSYNGHIKNYDLMKKYYLMALDTPLNDIENANITNKLGYYYYQIEKNNELAKKYYLISISKGGILALNNLAIYYQLVEKNYNLAEEYYIEAIRKGNVTAMYSLAAYHRNNKDFDQMKKYLLMAIDNGSILSMYELAYHYYKIEVNNKLMKKYFLMAIKGKYSEAMTGLGKYYQDKKKYTLMKKYYLMAIDEDNSTAMNNLGYYYMTIKDHMMMKKYYLMSINKGNSHSVTNLGQYYYDKNKLFKALMLYVKYVDLIDRNQIIYSINNVAKSILNKKQLRKFIEIIQTFEFNDNDDLCVSLKLLIQNVKIKIDSIKSHFEYSWGGSGYIEASRDFFKRVK